MEYFHPILHVIDSNEGVSDKDRNFLADPKNKFFAVHWIIFSSLIFDLAPLKFRREMKNTSKLN